MSSVRVELDYKGIHELLNSPEMHEVIGDFAKKARERAGSGYNYEVRDGSSPGSKGRAKATIVTADYQAMKHEFDTNSLLKAIGGKT